LSSFAAELKILKELGAYERSGQKGLPVSPKALFIICIRKTCASQARFRCPSVRFTFIPPILPMIFQSKMIGPRWLVWPELCRNFVVEHADMSMEPLTGVSKADEHPAWMRPAQCAGREVAS
jgi:hypothetical protein